MRCKKATELMMARLDDQLDYQSALLLDEHLEACSGCRAEWRRMYALDSLFRSAPTISAPLNLRVQITRRINRRERARRIVVGSLTLALGTTTLALLSLIPIALGFAANLGVAPALLIGGVETASQLLTLLDAVARLIIVLLDHFAVPFIVVSMGSLALAVLLNGLWITAMRRLHIAG